MMRVLVDTNVVLDVLLARRPHLASSTKVLVASEAGRLQAFLAAHSIPTVYYLVRKDRGHREARRAIGRILTLFEIASIDRSVLQEALPLEMSDYEDAIVAAAARRARCECIVTRDAGGFRKSPVRAVAPEVLLTGL